MSSHDTIPSPSRELPPDYTVVEVGVGSHPFPPAPTILESMYLQPNTAWSFTESRSYTGIDRGLFDAPLAREYLSDYAQSIQRRRPAENIRFLFGDVLDPDLDVAPKSADELLMCNVLSSDLEDETIDHLLQQAGRLLVQGGLLVIRETFTPDLHPPDALLPRLERLRFEQPAIVGATHPDFDVLTQYYGAVFYDMKLFTIPLCSTDERYFGFALAP